MKNFNLKTYLFAGIGLLAFAGSAFGGAAGSGSIGFCGGGGVIVDATHITWSPPNGSLGAGWGCDVTGNGTAITYNNGPGMSGTIGSNVTGNIRNLPAVGDMFLTFPGAGGYNLDFVLSGFGPTNTTSTACSDSLPNECIVTAGSPFDLLNNANGVAVTLSTVGTIVDGGVTSVWNAIFTTQLSSIPQFGGIATDEQVQDVILGDGVAAGSIGPTSWSATLTVTPIPEPGTVTMFLLSGIALIGIGRKRFGKP
jgi:hypothetical protein